MNERLLEGIRSLCSGHQCVKSLLHYQQLIPPSGGGQLTAAAGRYSHKRHDASPTRRILPFPKLHVALKNLLITV